MQDSIIKQIEHKVYMKAQEASDIQGGDWVEVTKIVPTGTAGWGGKWEQYMDNAVGKIYQVSGCRSNEGIDLCCVEGRERTFFPYFVLERCKAPYKFNQLDQVLVRDREKEKWIFSLYAGEMYMKGEEDGRYKERLCYLTLNGDYWRQCIPYIGNERLMSKCLIPEYAPNISASPLLTN